MIKRSLIISSPSRLSLKYNQLVCCGLDDEQSKSAPIEDLGVVIVENQRSVLSIPLLNALADNNVTVIFCDGKTMPNSMMVSLSANTTQGEMLRAQAAVSQTVNKRLWKKVIEAKIKNQSALLNKLGKDGDILKPFYSNVKSGDVDNREGIAAKMYWKELFGPAFVRDRNGESPNCLLNYGYSILRSAVTRALIGSGISPAIGIFHRNRYNPMPLSDDMMEPYRVYVDEIVYELAKNGEHELTTDVKGFLIEVLSCDTLIGDMRRPLQLGLSTTTASLGRCFKGEDKVLALPEFR